MTPEERLRDLRESFEGTLQPEARFLHRAGRGALCAGARRGARASLLLFGALAAYTGEPVFIKWSLKLRVPSTAELTTVALPARSEASGDAWFGLQLAYRPGERTLSVESVLPDGLAKPAGVLPGDRVAGARQAGEVVFAAADLGGPGGARLAEAVAQFIGGPPGQPLQGAPAFDPGRPIEVDFRMGHVSVDQRAPYLAPSVVVCRSVMGAVLLTLATALYDIRLVKKMFVLHTVRKLLIPGLGWATADLCEILANGKMNAALYSVIAQSRLVGIAMVSRCVLGTKLTVLQTLLLVSISLTILAYCQVPDRVQGSEYWSGFGKPWNPDDPEAGEGDFLVFVFALGKICLSITMGVLGQQALQHPDLRDLPLFTLQGIIFVVGCIPLLLGALAYIWTARWEYGFFGGAPAALRHCAPDWPASTCQSVDPVIVEQGWNLRLLAAVFFYIWRDLATNIVLRRFSALVKDLVNASSTVATYFLALLFFGKEFSVTQCAMIFTIALQIAQYCVAPRHEEPAMSAPPSGKVVADGTELAFVKGAKPRFST